MFGNFQNKSWDGLLKNLFEILKQENKIEKACIKIIKKESRF